MSPTNLFSLLLIALPFWIMALLIFLPDIARRYAGSRLASQRGAVTMLGTNAQLPDDWGPYVVQQNSEFEIIHRPIWDTQTITTTQSAQVNWLASAQATLDLGNEVLPLKNSYLIASLGLYFKDQIGGDNPPSNQNPFTGRANDHVLIVNTGILSLIINGKNYGDWPMFKLTPGAGIWGLVAGAGTPPYLDYSQMGAPDPRAMFKLAIPLVVPMNTKTSIYSTWPGGSLSLVSSSKLTLILDGKEARVL